ncbi:MAG: Ribosomal RNA small subunit methyltransferase G [Thermoanaerobacterales bacterium 50_218]|nr:MAG: Ribosomal RNA small subunit methyltransferase G [Thermoanaerobacterales bacterium 50_218]
MFLKYIELLDQWNSKCNLIKIRDHLELVEYHFLDSLQILRTCSWEGRLRVVDIGTGAGFPGVPLKICLPNLEMYLVEAQRRRCVFLQQLIEELNLTGCYLLCNRAEILAHNLEYRAAFDRVVVRAVSSLPVVLELGLPFLKEGGFLVAMRGVEVQDEINKSSRALSLLGGEVNKIVEYQVGERRPHHLLIVRKVFATPPKYPRRPGIPQKRPL